MIFAAIIEDNPLAAELIREYIEGPEIRVNAIYRSGEEALEEIPQIPLPDILLVDIGLPGISGIEATRRLKDKFPDVEILIQTVFEDTASIIAAIKAGASGYILKASSRDEMIRAIMEVRRGGSFLSGRIARKILQEFKSLNDSKPVNVDLASYSLTAREEEILRELIRGAAYKEIANRFEISIHTVNNHIRKIYEKMRVNSRGEAVAKAMGASDQDGSKS
jgi:DNA-binding NarL/FixJ family response regulator